MTFRFVAALAGIATSVIGLVLSLIPGSPATGFDEFSSYLEQAHFLAGPVFGVRSPEAQSARAIATFYTVNNTVAVVSSVGLVLIFILLTVFAAGLWTTLRDAERERGEAWAVIGLLGAAGTSGTFTVAAAVTMALVRVANATTTGQDAVVVALFNIQDLIFELGAVFIVLFLVGFSLAGQRTRAMPTWLAWVGYVSAVLAVATGLIGAVAPKAIPPYGFYFETFGTQVWVFIGSIWLIRRSRHVLSAPAPANR